MTKLTQGNVGSLVDVTAAQTKINDNYFTLINAFENTLSRDGTSPNPMGSSLDMNSFDILNLPAPSTNNSPIRVTELNAILAGSGNLPAAGSTGALLYKQSGSSFDTAWTNTSGIFVDNASGKLAVSQIDTPTILHSTGARIQGTNTNDSVAAGYYGEYISSQVLIGSAVSLITATAKTITSISLTAGDWDVTFNAQFLPNTTTSVTEMFASISLVDNTLDSTPGRFNTRNTAAFVPANNPQSAPVGPCRFSLASTTTLFGVLRGVFTVSTETGYGLLSARRVR